jgi:hypothetical protein
MSLGTALEAGREEASEYPEGPWPPVLAHLVALEEALRHLLAELDDPMSVDLGDRLTAETVDRLRDLVDQGEERIS